MSLLSGHEIIDKEIMTELELLRAAKNNEVAIIDLNQFEPISWEELTAPHRKIFQEICDLARQPGNHYVEPEIKTYSIGVGMGGRQLIRDQRSRKVQHCRLVRDEQKTERVPETTLLSFLRDKSRQTKIPASQYDEIQKGWGITQEKRILLAAGFEIPIEEKKTTELSYCEGLDNIQIEKKGLGKTVHTHREQLPAAFNLCASLLLEHVDSKKMKEINFTRKKIEDLAEGVKVGKALARDIHKNLPPILKGKGGEKPKNQP